MIIQSAITIFHVDRPLNRSLEICPESHVNMVDARLFHGCPLTFFVYLTISSNEKYGQERAESDPLTFTYMFWALLRLILALAARRGLK